jgi:hypothetical protein
LLLVEAFFVSPDIFTILSLPVFDTTSNTD